MYISSPREAASARILGSLLTVYRKSLVVIPRQRTNAQSESRRQDGGRGRTDSTGRPPVPDWRRHKLCPSCPLPPSLTVGGRCFSCIGRAEHIYCFSATSYLNGPHLMD